MSHAHCVMAPGAVFSSLYTMQLGEAKSGTFADASFAIAIVMNRPSRYRQLDGDLFTYYLFTCVTMVPWCSTDYRVYAEGLRKPNRQRTHTLCSDPSPPCIPGSRELVYTVYLDLCEGR